MITVNIIPHLRWNRESDFSAAKSKIYLAHDLREILEFLEKHPEFPNYLLDGQMAIVEDYLQLYPEDRNRLKKLVQAGRLSIGPWYTQTDQMMVSGESLVRNLYYGIQAAKKIGQPMMIGYAPNAFGHSAQLPQILNNFGIKKAIIWRGISNRNGGNKAEFVWQSSGHSQVTVQLLPLGYQIGKKLPTNPQDLKKRMDQYFKTLDEKATGKNEIIPNGANQMPIQKNISEVLEQLKKLYPNRKFCLNCYEKTFAELESKNLSQVQGEFIDGQNNRVHRTIYSTRADLKAANTRIENKITNQLEPLLALAFCSNFTYPKQTMADIWKKLLTNHAQDSMAACCSDQVNQQIKTRYQEVEESVDQLINFYQRKISQGIKVDQQQETLVLYNSLPQSRDAVINCSLRSNFKQFKLIDSSGQSIPYQILHQKAIQISNQSSKEMYDYQIQFEHHLKGLSYEALTIEAGKSKKVKTDFPRVSVIENKYYQILPNDDGTVDLLVKSTGQVYENILSLVNEGDCGDEYDFSPLADNIPLLSSMQVRSYHWFKITDTSEELSLNYHWKLPKNLQSRQKKLFDGGMVVTLNLILKKNDPVIGLKLKIASNLSDQRTRLLVPTKIKSKFSIADNQFGVIKRSVNDTALLDWSKNNWQERPDPIYPFLTHVALANDSETVGVITNSVKEYQVVGEQNDTLAITLWRSVGKLGKKDLRRRPGRASGYSLQTPDSQMHGLIQFDLGLVYLPGDYQTTNLPIIAKSYLTPVMTFNEAEDSRIKLNPVNKTLPLSKSLGQIKLSGVVVSTVKVAEDLSGIVVRLFNTNSEVVKVKLSPKIQLLDLNENPKKYSKDIILEQNEFITIKLSKK